MARTDQHESTARELLMELRNPDPTKPLIARLRDRHASFVGGQEERVFVALDADGSEPEMFEVRGESMPVYFARAVSPNAIVRGSSDGQ